MFQDNVETVKELTIRLKKAAHHSPENLKIFWRTMKQGWL